MFISLVPVLKKHHRGKIDTEYIDDKRQRQVSFFKRKTTLMKNVSEAPVCKLLLTLQASEFRSAFPCGGASLRTDLQLQISYQRGCSFIRECRPEVTGPLCEFIYKQKPEY